MPTAWDTKTIHFLTQAELKRLFKAIQEHKRDRTILLTAYRHGLRASEIPLMQVSDIDMERNRIRIHRLKNSLDGVHPMQPDEIRFIKAMIKERALDSPFLFLSRKESPICRRQLDRIMKTYGGRAKIPEHKRHFHALKHSIATHLLDAGAELRFVQDWIGHASIKNTLVYAQLTSHRRDEEARKVFMRPEVV